MSGTDNATGNVSLEPQTITYTHFDKTEEINEGIHGLNITYGPGEFRKKAQFMENGVEVSKRYYGFHYERTEVDGLITEITYLPGGVVHYKKSDEPSAKKYYLHFDHQGSVLALTDENAIIQGKQSYDAWGRMRNPDTWTQTANATPLPSWLTRGYTGHEHYTTFGLINMNGRTYDPLLARMMQVDNYVQAPHFTQSHNRYSYVFNNPLKYTDPTGEITWADVGAAALIVGGAILATTPAAPIGFAMITAGLVHFAWTLDGVINNGMNWNQASNYAGINMTVSSNVNSGNSSASQRKANRNYRRATRVARRRGPLDLYQPTINGNDYVDPSLTASTKNNFVFAAMQQRGDGELSPNSAYSVRGNNVDAWDLFAEFNYGIGPESSLFTGNHPMVEDLKNSWVVNLANAKYFEGNQESLLRYDAPFGIFGLMESWTWTEQILGGVRISITPMAGGRLYTVDNTMGRYSYHLHFDTDIPRDFYKRTPKGNTYHRFIWFER